MQTWLDKTMAQSAAGVIVLLGRQARIACTKRWKLDATKSVHFGCEVGGRERAVLALPHPNAFEPKKVVGRTSPVELARLRALLAI